ncbi:MAG: type IV pilin protein [Saezia sp.]
MMKLNNKQFGFTLIELMIVIAIIGILAAFGYPSYARYIERGHRAEAQATMLEALQLAQQYYVVRNTYVGFNLPVSQTPSGRYAITAQVKDGAYTITATPKNMSVECGTLTINSLNDKTVASGSTVKDCW